MPVMAVVMIGVDPHKGSHTAVAIDAAEQPLGQLRVRASAVQAERLGGWARAWPQGARAGEGARGDRPPPAPPPPAAGGQGAGWAPRRGPPGAALGGPADSK